MANWYQRIIKWVDSRIGLTNTVLRPGPQYSLNVFYWLGALMVIAFLVQGVTGLLMLLYYVPSVDLAYSSTLFIINYVPLGLLLETVHLYSAYAMVILAFLHMMRGYFVSVQKKPRELMWVVGMLMGLVVLGFGLTGYLLPWTVQSKSATDVTIGMLSFLPGGLGPTLTFLIAGTGSDAAMLARFFDLHVVVLPAVFAVLLGLKMYMFEIHGAAPPPTGSVEKTRLIPWFPGLFVYFSILAGAFLALLLGISALFPMSLAPRFTPEAAAAYTSQPEWYFLWMYQILKFSIFEGAAIVVALSAVTVGLVVLIWLPFIDRKADRDPARRPIYTTLGVIVTVELVVLAVWGYFTPGQVIPNIQAAIVVGGVALVITFMSWVSFRARSGLSPIGLPIIARTKRRFSLASFMGTPFQYPMLTLLFTLLLGVSSAALASTAKLLQSPQPNPTLLGVSSFIAAVSMFFMGSLVRKFATPRRSSVVVTSQ